MNNICRDPAVVAWFAKASVFHSVNSAPSANGGLNAAWGIIMVANAPAVRKTFAWILSTIKLKSFKKKKFV